MKTIKYNRIAILFVTGVILISSCKKKYSDEYTRYDPTPVTEESVGLKYNTPLESYPVMEAIVSDTPSYTIESYYFFEIDSIYSTTGGDFAENRFGISSETGVISYDNTTNSISSGKYVVDVLIVNLTGITTVKSAFELSILEIPITVTASPDQVTVTPEDTGIISQLSYTVDGNPDPPLTSVNYSISPGVTGFSVNEAGEINMQEGVEAGVYNLSIMTNTNLGKKYFENVLTVTVQ